MNNVNGDVLDNLYVGTYSCIIPPRIQTYRHTDVSTGQYCTYIQKDDPVEYVPVVSQQLTYFQLFSQELRRSSTILL